MKRVSNEKVSMEELMAYCNQYGFIFQGSEIYGGLANTWDYGPLGTRLKNNLKDAWRYYFIQKRENSFELDSDILMNPMVWKASGHLEGFSDPLLDCKECKTRHRADNLIEDYMNHVSNQKGNKSGQAFEDTFDQALSTNTDAYNEASHTICFDSIRTMNVDAMSQEQMMAFVREHQVPCPNCRKSNFTDIRQFNLMFATQRGVTGESTNTVYLRPENAQGEYVNYLNVLRTMRSKLPFSIGQIGKAFRNEITPGNFTFRTIEFEQMEFQTFCRKGEDEGLYEFYKEYGIEFFEYVGLKRENLRFHDHEKLAHYAKAACDIEYLFPFGYGEINGTHNRTDFDLNRHQEFSGKSMEYFDQEANEKYVPYIIESTYGLDRLVLAILFENLRVEELADGDVRQVLKIRPSLAPMKVNVLPLIKKKHANMAHGIYSMLSKYFMVSYDEAGNIGKRYRRGDAIGTPYAVTIDDDTIVRGLVTVRDRDTMKQETIKIDQLVEYVRQHLEK